MKKIILFTFSFFITSLSLRAEYGIAVYSRISSMPEEVVERICKSKLPVYIGSQESRPLNTEERVKYEKLIKAGKKIILQIWWGPGGKFNWAKYSFPNISQNVKIRNEFFKKVVAPIIDSIGIENLYGVHLLEETGGQFGVDIDYQKDKNLDIEKPIRLWMEDGNPYNNPRWNDVTVRNIRRYNEKFKKDTELDMDFSSIWNKEEWFVFKRWVHTELNSKAIYYFSKYIKKNYPSLKVFTWEGINSGNWKVLKNSIDGVMRDDYSAPKWIYLSCRTYRTFLPEGDFYELVAGHYNTPAPTFEIKFKRVLAAYKGGANIVGFYETDGKKVKKPDVFYPEIWETNQKVVGKVLKEKKPEIHYSTVLIDGSNYVSNIGHFLEIRNFDRVPLFQGHLIDFSRYKLAIIYTGIEYPPEVLWDRKYIRKKYNVDGIFDGEEIEKFVEKGNNIVIIGKLDISSKTPFTRILKLSPSGRRTGMYRIKPDDWWKKNFKLKNEYNIRGTKYNYVSKTVQALENSSAFLIEYGKGKILFIPYTFTTYQTSSRQLEDIRIFLSDIISGFLKYSGNKKLSKEIFSGL